MDSRSTGPADRPARVWTDGSCRGNPGPGGWGWVDDGGSSDSGAEAHTTNQRMELTAAREAVATHPGPVEVVSDSKYVVSAFNEGWIEGWLRRGWKNSKKEPVANKDLWQPFVEEVAEHGAVRFAWVKGHAGDPMNEEADRLATEAAATVGANASTAAATAPATAASTPARRDDPRAPAGFRYAVTGTRRLEARALGAARAQLAKILPAQQEFHPDLVVLLGLRPGPEAMAAEVALEAGLTVVAVLPWPDPQTTLRSADREAFGRLLARVDETIVLERSQPTDADGRAQALARRDSWLAGVADGALLVRQGDSSESRALLRRFAGLGAEVWDLDLAAEQ